MTAIAASAFSSAPLWYLTRSTGVIAFVLLTLTFVLGLAATQRALASPLWPRFATQELHRNLSLLGLAFLLVHVVTTLADTFVHVGWWAWVVPFVSGYRPLWVGLGTTAFDLVVLLVVTSLVRDRLPLRLWRAVHWAAYGVWPLTVIHFMKTGTDAARGRWGLYLDLGAFLLVALAVVLRWLTPDRPRGPLRSVRRQVEGDIR